MAYGYYGYSGKSDGERILDSSLKLINAIDAVDTMYQKDQQQVSQGRLLQLAQERGGLDNIGWQDTQNLNDWMALGALRKQNADMMSQQKNAYKDKIDRLNMQYNNEIYPLMRTATEAYNKGDFNTYAGCVENLSNMAHSPYRYKWDPQNGTFMEYFRSDQKMGFTPTGRAFTPQQAQDQFNQMMRGTLQVQGGINGQLININPDFAITQLRQMLATDDGNAASMMKPKEVRGPDGKIYKASIVNPIYDKEHNQNLYNMGPALVVFDPKTGQRVDMVSAAEGKYQWLTPTDQKLYEKSLGLGKGGRGSGSGGRSGGTGGGTGGTSPARYDIQRGDISATGKFVKSINGGAEDPDLQLKVIQLMQNMPGGYTKEAIFAGILQEAKQKGVDPRDVIRGWHASLKQGGAKPKEQEAQQQGTQSTQGKGNPELLKKVEDRQRTVAEGSSTPSPQGSSGGVLEGIGSWFNRMTGKERDYERELIDRFLEEKRLGNTQARSMPEWLAETHTVNGQQRDNLSLFENDANLYQEAEQRVKSYRNRKKAKEDKESSKAYNEWLSGNRMRIEEEQKKLK